MAAQVKRTGRTWGVFVGGRLVEGGFFSRSAAVECAASVAEDDDGGVCSECERGTASRTQTICDGCAREMADEAERGDR